MITLLANTVASSGFSSTSVWYAPKFGGIGNRIGGVAKMSPPDFKLVATIQYTGNR
jgi:hypothetical protein